MGRITYVSIDELKVEGSLLKMFLGFAYVSYQVLLGYSSAHL